MPKRSSLATGQMYDSGPDIEYMYLFANSYSIRSDSEHLPYYHATYLIITQPTAWIYGHILVRISNRSGYQDLTVFYI
jgi:hypothetical protein